MDYTLRIKVTPEAQPVAVALIESKTGHLPVGYEQEHGEPMPSRRV